MKFPKELIARVEASLSHCQVAQPSMDALEEISAVALGLAKGDHDLARALILNDFEDWVSRTGRLDSSYNFNSYPSFQKGKRSRSNLFCALAWTYMLPTRTAPTSAHKFELAA